MPFNLTTFLALEEFLVVGRPKEMQSRANRYMLATQSGSQFSYCLSCHSFIQQTFMVPLQLSKTILGAVDTRRQRAGSVPEWNLYYSGEDRQYITQIQ